MIENGAAVETFGDLFELKVIRGIVFGGGVDGLKLGSGVRRKNGFGDGRQFSFRLGIR
jgi:hypothetical protein